VFPPKNLTKTLPEPYRRNLWFSGQELGPLPHSGDKKPECRITSFNSASQIRVIKRGEAIETPADCQPGLRLISLFPRHREGTEMKLSAAESSARGFLNFF
jgi:hypothetical protein